MKKLIVFVAIITILSSCGGGNNDQPNDPPSATNSAPGMPSLSAPTNNLLCIDNVVHFQRTASTDPDSDAVVYDFQIAADSQFSQNVQNFNGLSSTTKDVTLEKGVAYYWRVKAKDSKNESSSYSTIYSFYTEGVGVLNHLPFTPTLVAPILNTTVQGTSIELKWTANDVDNDPLNFDIYLDTMNPPTTKVTENQSETSLNQSLEPSKNYYWRVVVKDGKGGQTRGQVWNFNTD